MKEDSEYKFYTGQDVEKILDKFKKVLEDTKEGTGTLFQNLFDDSVEDLRQFNRGKLILTDTALEPFEEFINTFGTRYNGELTPEGAAAKAKLYELNEQNKKQKIALIIENVARSKQDKKQIIKVGEVKDTKSEEKSKKRPSPKDFEMAVPLAQDLVHEEQEKTSSTARQLKKKPEHYKNSHSVQNEEEIKEETAYQDNQPEPATKTVMTETKRTTQQKQKLSQRIGQTIKSAWKKGRKWVITGAVLIGGLVLARQCGSCEGGKDDKGRPTIPVLPVPTPTPERGDTLVLHSDDIAKAYYDSALKIHLGEKNRDTMYEAIEDRAKKGELDLAGFSVERFAHSMVMYQKIQPDNQINQTFNKLLKGQKLSKADKLSLRKAVIQSGEYGDGVKGTGKHSNYDRQSRTTQLPHNQVLKNFRNANAGR